MSDTVREVRETIARGDGWDPPPFFPAHGVMCCKREVASCVHVEGRRSRRSREASPTIWRWICRIQEILGSVRESCRVSKHMWQCV